MTLQNLEFRIGKGEDGHLISADFLNLALILALCATFAYLRWLKIDTLVWGDPARWLFEGQRVAAGEMPYRDFSWAYPPFSVVALGWVMKWFSVSFHVAQVFVDTISVIVVFLAYLLIRLLLPRFLHAPAMFCLIVVCGTSLMFFNLFSFLTYVPALQTGAAGFLLFLTGVLMYVRNGNLRPTTWLMVTLGSFVAAFSKPESLVATLATLAVLAIGDRTYWFSGRKTSAWLRHYLTIGIACTGPAVVAYLITGRLAGFGNLRAGIAGYGLATAICPWWPTGLGMFGAAASLGEAAFIAAALSLTRRKQFASRFGRGYYYGLAAGLVGLCLYFGYVLNSNWNLLMGNRSLGAKLWYSAHNTVGSSAVLLPVMWTCVILWFYLVQHLLLAPREKRHTDSFEMLVLLTGPVAMSARGWFNWNHGVQTEVPGICYPFFLILAPYLSWRLLAAGGPGPDLGRGIRTRPGIAIVVLLTVYGLIRAIAAYPSLLSNGPYHDLSTVAGNIRVQAYAVNSEIYRFVLENSSPNETVLDLPYGGGINFAAHRLSPSFATQFRDYRMSDTLLEKDLENLRRRPPRVVIVDNAPNYGAIYGLRDCTCTFPRMVWAPGTTTVVPEKIFPPFLEISQNYRVAKVVGQKLLLVPR